MARPSGRRHPCKGYVDTDEEGRGRVPAPVVKSLQYQATSTALSRRKPRLANENARAAYERSGGAGYHFVGLDVHKPWINVAALLPGHDTPIEWRIANETQAIRKMLKRVASLTAGDVRYCYEAGPAAMPCSARSSPGARPAACSWLPRSSHAKARPSASRPIAVTPRGSPFSSRRTAHRGHPLTEEDESGSRPLPSARDLREDLVRARHRLGSSSSAGRSPSPREAGLDPRSPPLARLAPLRQPAHSVVVADYLLAIRPHRAANEDPDRPPRTPRSRSAIRPAVATLRCFRSVDTITASASPSSCTTSNASPPHGG